MAYSSNITTKIQNSINMRNLPILVIALSIMLFSCQDNTNNTVEDETNDLYSGGQTSVFYHFSDAYEQPSHNMSDEGVTRHLDGDALFGGKFISAEGEVNPGLGPLFNQNACERCHTNNGRSMQATNMNDLKGLLIRLSMPGEGSNGDAIPVEGFGTQLQNKATFGVQKEADVDIVFTETQFSFPDGEKYSLRKPTYNLINAYTTIPAGTLTSPRIASAVIGLGLIEALSPSEILKYEDENDANKDGISGKANYSMNIRTNKLELGKFGWKATEPDLYQQSAKAFLGDMGLTSPFLPNESFAGQIQDDKIKDDPELTNEQVELAAFYVKSIAVPGRRNTDNSDVKAGKQLFKKVACNGCHISNSYKTSPNVQEEFLRNQTIFPYSDFLLHDMGPELADNRPDHKATGTEWRTAPLWGIGLSGIVNGHTSFLHDGRARNFVEAIMWHGGEAETSKQNFAKLSKNERNQLISYLLSL